ncbi:neurocan core protein [Pimephales promelas]|uniref:neurocan core protein n=1 Tax=Pimephales promelas TaxID=90988 RepID=UPI001955BA4B|nr:neurocan core protein [Pimephales promelas]
MLRASAGGLQVLSVLLVFSAGCGVTEAETLVTVRRVTHPPVRRQLAESALLPCVFTLTPALVPGHGPYIHWTRGSGAQERTVLSARDGVVRVHQAYAGRISLPGYSHNHLNASLALNQLRSDDSGTFRCHVALGDSYEQDTVNLEITGVVFHYRSPVDGYSLSYAEAVAACEDNSAQIASVEQLWAAFHSSMSNCEAGWLNDQSVRYLVQTPELGCFGHTEFSRGVRNYGKRDPSELFDVYCFANDMQGEVFPVSVPDGLTRVSASALCESSGARLATVGQLSLAWTSGLDHCEPGWVSDGSVRSVRALRSECPGGEPGVTTVPSTELRNGSARFDAFCYRAKRPQKAVTGIVKSLLRPWRYMTGDDAADAQSDLPDLRPSNWTGQVDLDKDLDLHMEAPELSAEYLTARLRAGDTYLDWSGQLDSFPDGEQVVPAPGSDPGPGGSATEEEDEDLSGQSVSPTAPQGKGKSSLNNIVSSLWKPWSYLTGSDAEASVTTPVMDTQTTATRESEDDRCSCLHGGTCLPHGEAFRCFCPQGYAGESCEIDVDDCQSNPCENGGTCIDKEDSFVCVCLPSYSGDRCERDTEGCEHGWKKFHGHCYRVFPRRHTWEDAEKDCREHSGHLTSITSSLELDFLNGLGHENVWIGLNDRTVEEDFQWTDGTDVVFENWRENQPDNFFAGGEDCVVMITREDGKWNDVPCNYNLPYICKKGSVMCGTPPAVDNASLVGRRRSHYDLHAVVRYQCANGFFQRHIPTVRCRPSGVWERPKIICTKSRRSHRYRRQHHRSRREHRRHRRHGSGHRGRS